MEGNTSRNIFARNLVFYVERSGKTQKEIANIIGVSKSTFNDWVKGKKYPRMNMVELLANYFGILKSDLIEEKLTQEKEKDNDAIVNIIVRLRMDMEFLNTVEALAALDAAKLKGVQEMLKAFTK